MTEIKNCRDCIYFIPEEGEEAKAGVDRILDMLSYLRELGRVEPFIDKLYKVLISSYQEHGMFTGKIWCTGIGYSKDSTATCDNPLAYVGRNEVGLAKI